MALGLFWRAFQRFIGDHPLAAAPLGAQDGIWLARINQTLKAMPPMSGRFEQKLPNGGHAAGSYAIDWPSRLRFAYDGGGGIVTVKGKFVAVQEQPGGEPKLVSRRADTLIGFTPSHRAGHCARYGDRFHPA